MIDIQFSDILKFDYYLGSFDVGMSNEHRLGIHVFAAGQLEGYLLVIGVDKFAFHSLAVEGRDRQVLADVFAVLAFQLQRRVEACRCHVEFKVFFVAIEAVLDGATERDAVVDSDAVVAIDGHIDAVVGRNLQVDEELVAARQSLVYYIKYIQFVNHRCYLQ